MIVLPSNISPIYRQRGLLFCPEIKQSELNFHVICMHYLACIERRTCITFPLTSCMNIMNPTNTGFHHTYRGNPGRRLQPPGSVQGRAEQHCAGHPPNNPRPVKDYHIVDPRTHNSCHSSMLRLQFLHPEEPVADSEAGSRRIPMHPWRTVLQVQKLPEADERTRTISSSSPLDKAAAASSFHALDTSEFTSQIRCRHA